MPKLRRSRLAIASLILALSGWMFHILSFAIPVLGLDFVLPVFLILTGGSWLMSLVIGIAALVGIKRKHGACKGRTEAIAGICISIIPVILFMYQSYLATSKLSRLEPFREADPSCVIAFLEKSFDLKLPTKVKLVKAVETESTWLEHTYIFILDFITDHDGFAQFRNSLPQKYGWCDIGEYDPRTNYIFPNVPDWHKAKIRKGQYYKGPIYSKNKMIRIDTVCADTADPQKVVVYMEGWGRYYPGYGLHYINPDNPKSVRWLLDHFTEKMRVKCPDDTTLINAKQLSALYGHAYLKIGIDRESLEKFIGSSPFSETLLRDDKRFCNNEPDLAWWDPGKPKVYKSGETKLSNIELLRILIDVDDPNKMIVYLEWLEI